MRDAAPQPIFDPPERFNIAEYFLGDRIREGRGGRRALLTDGGEVTYAEVDALANRYGHLLRSAGVRPEERVLIALPDGPDFVGALFGTLRIGAVGVMLNPFLRRDEISYFFRYTRGAVLLVDSGRAPFFREGISAAPASAAAHEAGIPWDETPSAPRETFVVDEPAFAERLRAQPATLEPCPTHRDDAALWLFSGGTTGRPKGVVQTHASFANTTESYGKRVLGLTEDDITLSVPKLFFGYATGSNLFFPFAVGATAALFPERCTPDVLFERIARFRPTVLVNVPTMIRHMVAHPDAAASDLSSLRLATSAGEALPPELHRRWRDRWGVTLLDGLGTAEMWHIFLSNRPDEVHPGTLGRAVPGFEVRVCDDEGRELPDGEVGWLWVRGGSRALGYWQRAGATAEAFRGEWYVSGDMIVRDERGVFRYCGRGDDMLKVKGKWLSPGEVEDCLLQHPAVAEAAVVGVPTPEGLLEPVAWIVPTKPAAARVGELAPELREFVGSRLSSYKTPAAVHVAADLPRTHLGKVDRAALRDRSRT
ncbi:MAG: benzoate-CoA ligase family protein [Gemmatimonadota bacterium]|uniref:benzoate-CoA ligase family protein n=1 Tax=Candidatus Palauibacter scopulicola TaxID=3056741 RepID=UPI0023837EB7|nr:benzoate-CoA ligase family protein [Candidatus Palauibacter scopulicola]MDE2662003.1 benzoate-CoA ligase family protein [Candidatus Palauibacter scopulicola]